MLLGLAGMALLNLIVAWNARGLIRKGYPDFTMLYSAGKIVREGSGHQLYDDAVQDRVQREFAGDVTIRQGALPFIHAPFEALMFVPFTFLPYLPAFLLWDFISLLILLGIFFLLRGEVPMVEEIGGPAWMLAGLAFFPIFMGLLQGQDMIALVGCVALFYVSLRHGHDLKAGLWLGLGTFRFNVIVPLLLILISKRKSKVLLGFGLTALALILISGLVIGWHGLLEYPRYVLRHEREMPLHRTINPLLMPNLRGLLDGFLLAWASQVVKDAVTVGCSVLLLLFAASKWKASDLGFALCVVAVTLAGYHALLYDLSLLLFPIVLVLAYIREHGSLSRMELLGLAGPIVFLFVSPLHWILALDLTNYSVLAWVTLIWFVVISYHVSRQERFQAHSTV